MKTLVLRFRRQMAYSKNGTTILPSAVISAIFSHSYAVSHISVSLLFHSYVICYDPEISLLLSPPIYSSSHTCPAIASASNICSQSSSFMCSMKASYTLLYWKSIFFSYIFSLCPIYVYWIIVYKQWLISFRTSWTLAISIK